MRSGPNEPAASATRDPICLCSPLDEWAGHASRRHLHPPSGLVGRASGSLFWPDGNRKRATGFAAPNLIWSSRWPRPLQMRQQHQQQQAQTRAPVGGADSAGPTF